jgi:hypothetical protein
MVIGSECLIIKKLEILPTASDAPPGTIVAMAPEAIRVTTGTKDVALCELLTQNGQPIQVSDLVDRYGVVEGTRLKPLDETRILTLNAQNEAISKYEAYWLTRLSGITPLRLPSGTSFPKKKEGTPYQTLTCLSSEIMAGFPETKWPWAKERILLAAHLAYFFRLQEHAVGDVGLVSETFLNQLPGLKFLFSRMVPLRVEWKNQQTFLDYLGSVSEAYERIQKRAPFLQDLMARCPEMKSGQHKHLGGMFSITFVMGKQDFMMDLGDSVRWSDLTIVLSDHGTEYHWQYYPGAVAPDEVERMHKQFQTFLTHAIAEPDQMVATIPILTDRERRQVLKEWNATTTSYPHQKSLTAQFETQALQQPDAIAVVWEDEQLTYQQLNHRANQVAHYLLRHGVGPDVVVGLCLNRSLEMIVAILGILKAGGAYVPLDPNYPPERLAFMAKDADLRVMGVRQKSPR